VPCYIYLARALKEVGFVPVIATHPCWECLVKNADIDFSPIGPDIKGSTDGIYKLCRNADLVIAFYSHAGTIKGQACQKPITSVTLQTEVIPQPHKPRTGWQKLTET